MHLFQMTYGRAGQFVREYFDYLHNRVTPETHIHLGLSPDDKLFSGNFISDAEAIFRKAEKVADNPEILRRVEMAELPLLYLKCRQTPELLFTTKPTRNSPALLNSKELHTTPKLAKPTKTSFTGIWKGLGSEGKGKVERIHEA